MRHVCAVALRARHLGMAHFSLGITYRRAAIAGRSLLARGAGAAERAASSIRQPAM